MTPYENLANAIIVQAAKDYREAMRDLKKNPRYTTALAVKSDCERFFRSDWFTVLTNVSGIEIMNALQKEAA